MLIQRFPVAKCLAIACMGWAILLLCSAATHNFAGLAALRFLMGMTEAFVFPVCSILTVMWWTTAEQPIRVAWWFNQVSREAKNLNLRLKLTFHRDLQFLQALSVMGLDTLTQQSTHGGSYS